MRMIKIGLANINTTVGALQSNTDKVIARLREMVDAGCTIGCFTEQVISGYPVEDLVLWKGFVDQQWAELERIRAATHELDCPTVFVVGLTTHEDGANYNCAAVVQSGKILGLVPKQELPTYDVFYEKRTYCGGTPGHVTEFRGVPFGDLAFRFPFGCLAVEVCEDLWVPEGPLRRRAFSGAELSLNISASPWRTGVVSVRRKIVTDRSRENASAVVYVNQVGGQDALVFDGGALLGVDGKIEHDAPRWRERISFCTLDLDRLTGIRESDGAWKTQRAAWLKENAPVQVIQSEIGQPLSDAPASSAPPRHAETPRDLLEDLLTAMKLGLCDYFEKTGVFKRIGVALSGGKDSALTLIVAWLYARDRFRDQPDDGGCEGVRDFLHAFSMPTRYNTDATRRVARNLCEELGVTFREVSIEQAFGREEQAVREMLGEGVEPDRLTLQNIQARIRGARMWNWANSASGLWLQSGNMSEKAVGYTTIGGDMMGGYSLIGNLPKTQVIALLHYLHREYRIESLADLLPLQASAELEDDQEDERDLMPFAVLDACFDLFAGGKMMPVDLYRVLRDHWSDEDLRKLRADYRPGQLKDWVKRFVRLFAGSIYKWVQAPQAVHLGNLDLDRERALQLPVVQSREWMNLSALDAEP